MAFPKPQDRGRDQAIVALHHRKSSIPFPAEDDYIHQPVDVDLTEREREREAARNCCSTSWCGTVATSDDAAWRPSETEFDPRDAVKVTDVAINQPFVAEDTGLRELSLECWQIAEDHGFHDAGQSFGDKLMLIVSEAAEALEDFRDGHDPGELWYEKGTKPCGVPSEIADIIIRALDVGVEYGMDLMSVVREKMDYNRTRPYMHGKVM